MQKLHSQKRQHLLCILAVLSLASPARAQEGVDSLDLSPEQLFGAIVTSVSKSPEKLWNAPAAVYVLDSEDIQRMGVTSVAEALRRVPGVQVAKNSNSGWAVSIRGLTGALYNKLLVLIDGREVYDPLFSGVYWDIQDMVLEDIERIEVIRGPGATLWGSNAVNGVINITTKNASQTKGSYLNLVSGNQETGIGEVRYGAAMKNGGAFRVYGKSFFRNEFEKLDGTDANDEWKAVRTGFRTDWNSNNGDTWNVQGAYYYNEVGWLSTRAEFTAPFSRTINEEILARGGNLLATWGHTNDAGGQVEVKSYLNYTERAQSLLTNQRKTFDTDVQYQWPEYGRHDVITGVKYRFSRDDLGMGPLITAVEKQRTDHTFSGFIHDKITLKPDRWYLTLGSKLEHNDYTGVEAQPSARLQWHPSDTQMVWGAVSYAVRTPSRLEHDLHIISSTGQLGANLVSADLISDTKFESEKMTAYELGYRNHLTPKILLDTAAFFNEYHDLRSVYIGNIIQGTSPNRLILPFSYDNRTRAYTYGFETALDWQVRDNWKLGASYSFLDVNMKGPSETDERLSPQGQFNVHSALDITPKLTMDTMLYYVSALPVISVDDYWRLDSHVSWQVTPTIELGLTGQNLLAESHREFSALTDINAVRIPRSIYGSVTWRF